MQNFWQALPKPILALAPMVDVSDSAFRQLAKRWGADVAYSEMISADALARKSPKTLAMLAHEPIEQPFVVQLMGREPAVIAAAARIAVSRGAAGIDLNFGCPANKIAKNSCGAVLMRNVDLCRRLIAATIEAVNVPISIKVRVSINDQRTRAQISVLDLLEVVADLPIAAIMVHGRSFEDSFDGGIKIDVISQVKRRFTSGVVLANGGITTIESSKEVLEATRADGLGLARSAIGRPWIFRQIRDYLATGQYQKYDWAEIKNAMLEHAHLYESFRGPFPFVQLRRHLTHYVKGHETAGELREKLVHVNNPVEIRQILAAY